MSTTCYTGACDSSERDLSRDTNNNNNSNNNNNNNNNNNKSKVVSALLIREGFPGHVTPGNN